MVRAIFANVHGRIDISVYRDNKKAPEIARDYWRLGDKATMLDVIYAGTISYYTPII
jgi:hypothetical protein